jgi:2-hydroxychromene-2-carboxylate isomerase
MTKLFDFYFDFVSPYSFLAHKEIKKLEKRNLIKVQYMPILLGGLHNLHGIKAPAFIPSKARFMIRDCKLVAEKKKIKFKFNSYFPIKTVDLMRGVFIAKEDEFENYYIDKIFESIWRDGLNMNDQNIIDKVLKNININPKTFFLRASGESVKNLLRKKTDEAFEKGVFGAPTFLVNNKIFWGQDRLEYAIDETKK